MKVKGLDGKTYSWKLGGRSPLGQPGSSYHKRARLLLAELFPNDQRLEEVPLPGSRKLRGDFYLPARRLMVEVHGEQHYEFNLHMHSTPLGFLRSVQRDQNKKDWCDLNNIRHVELPYHESDGQWRVRILPPEDGR